MDNLINNIYPYGITKYEEELENYFSKHLSKKEIEDLNRQTNKFYQYKGREITRKASAEEIERIVQRTKEKRVLC